MPPIRHKEQPTPPTSLSTHHKKKRANITDDERHKILHAITNEGDTYSTASKRFMLPYNTVRSIFLTFLNTNRTSKLPRGGNRRRRLEKEHLEWIKARRLDEPDIPITDLHHKLNKHFRLKPPVSRSTIQNAVNKRLGYTLKLIHPEPKNYNDPDRIQARKTWTEQVYVRTDGLEDYVYVDESGFNLHIRRKFGRSPPNVRPVKRVEAQRGPNMSLVVAVDKTGLLASEVKFKAYKGIHFARFLQNKLFPKLKDRRVIIMDNCRIHKEKTVLNVLQHAHHTPLFLPAYTPHFNVAEWVFGRVKWQVKKDKVQNHTLAGVIRRSLLRSVTAVNVAGWLQEVKRNFLRAFEGRPLGRLMNTKQALDVSTESEDPYPEVEGEELEDDQDLWDDGEVMDNGRDDTTASSDSSDSDSDEVEEEKDTDSLVQALDDEQEEDNQMEEQEEDEEEEEKLQLLPTRTRYFLRRAGKAQT